MFQDNFSAGFSVGALMQQSVSLPQKNCEYRLGEGALGHLGYDLRSLVERPRLAALLCEKEMPASTVELLERNLIDVDFRVSTFRLPKGEAALEFSRLSRIFSKLAQAGFSSDDVLVAAGGRELLSAAQFIAGSYKGSMRLAELPFDPLSCLLSPTQPDYVQIGSQKQLLHFDFYPDLVIADLGRMDLVSGEESLLCRALMLATAASEGETALSHLSSRAENLVAGKENTWTPQLLESSRARAYLAEASSFELRAGLDYGWLIARALHSLLPKTSFALCFAEALRFSARLGISLEEDFDQNQLAFIEHQDELLFSLGLESLIFDLDPQKLKESIKKLCFEKSNRFCLPLPLELGRIRLKEIPEELFEEHLSAFCAAHRSAYTFSRTE